jgi:molecular chaperone GrpE
VQNKAKQEVDEHDAAAASRQRAGSPRKGRADAGRPAEGGAGEGAEVANRRADLKVDGEDVEVSTAADAPGGDEPSAEAERAAEPAATAADGAEDAEDGDAAAEADGDQERQEEQDQEEETAGPPADEEEDVPVTAEAPVQDDGQEVTAAAAEGEAAEGDAGERPDAEALVADLASVRSEAAGYLDDLRRLQADFDNYRKRMLREQTMRVAAASQALVSRLLPVLDNFELAISHAEQSRDFDRMLKGVEMVFGELREVLRSEGLSPIEAEGKPFDPSCHEAVVAVEEEGAEAGTVVDVVRTGYEFQGKVLRPAMVKVAK